MRQAHIIYSLRKVSLAEPILHSERERCLLETGKPNGEQQLHTLDEAPHGSTSKWGGGRAPPRGPALCVSSKTCAAQPALGLKKSLSTEQSLPGRYHTFLSYFPEDLRCSESIYRNYLEHSSVSGSHASLLINSIRKCSLEASTAASIFPYSTFM